MRASSSRLHVLFLLSVGFAAIAAAVLLAAPARAEVFEVTRTGDPAPDGCRPNNCTLREAVIASNNRSGPDRIKLYGKTYELHRMGTDENMAATGDLDIRKDLTIVGAGMRNTTVDGNDIDHVFHVVTPGEAAFRHLSIVDGEGGLLNQGKATLSRVKVANNTGGIDNSGRLALVYARLLRNDVGSACCGAGLATTGGRVTVKNSTIANNTTDSCCGGGIFSDGTDLTILRSNFHHNDLGSCCGGAVFVQGAGKTVIKRSKITDQTLASCCGAGVFNQQGSEMIIRHTKFLRNRSESCCGGALYSQDENSRVRVYSSVFERNRVMNCCGGAIYNQDESDMKIMKSKIIDNATPTNCCGGGLYNQDVSPLSIRDTVFRGNRTGNSATDLGGGLYSQETGQGNVDIRGSTFAGNTAYDGGGIWTNGNLALINSTFSNNEALNDGGGLYEDTAGTIYVSHVTFTRNEAGSTGSGIFSNQPPIEIFRSIVANNEGADCNAVIASTSVNLDRNSECFGGPGALHAPPRLKPLGDYGGRTPTHAIRATSAAVDAAASGACPPPSKDQRGVSRPQNGDGQGGARCDLGAFELRP